MEKTSKKENNNNEKKVVIDLTYLRNKENFLNDDNSYNVIKHYNAVEEFINSKINETMKENNLSKLETLFKLKKDLNHDLNYSLKLQKNNSSEKGKKISQLNEKIEKLKKELSEIEKINDNEFELNTAYKSLTYYFNKLN